MGNPRMVQITGYDQHGSCKKACYIYSYIQRKYRINQRNLSSYAAKYHWLDIHTGFYVSHSYVANQ